MEIKNLNSNLLKSFNKNTNRYTELKEKRNIVNFKSRNLLKGNLF